jgi:hypothetical protein
MEELDQYNILAIELIEYLGNNTPAQEQIDLVEYLVQLSLKNHYKPK